MCLSLLVALGGFAQSMNGTVVGIISLGTQDYCFISEDGTSNVFKTSPYTAGELQVQDEVDLRRTRIQNQVEVTADPLSTQLFAMLEVAVPGQSIYYPDVSRLPQLVDGILYFDDEAHLVEVYDMVTLFLEDESYDKGMDTKLDEIEQNEFPLFTSFRTYFNTRYNWVDGSFTELEIEDISNKDYVFDEIYKMFLNESALIGIDDRVYYYHDEDNIVSVLSTDEEGILTLGSIASLSQNEGYDLFAPFSIIFNARYSVHSTKGELGANPKGNVTGPTGVTYQSIPGKRYKECLPLEKGLLMELLVAGNNFYGSVTNVSLTIDWNDGVSSIQTINNYDGETIWHTFPTATFYYPKTTLTFDHAGYTISINDGNGTLNIGNITTAGDNIIFDASFTCTQNDNHDVDWIKVGNKIMECKAWVKHNTVTKQVGSYTHSWKQKTDGSWKREKALISAQCRGVFRDLYCVAEETRGGFKEHSNDKKIQKTKGKAFKRYTLGTGDIESWHHLQKSGVDILHYITVNPCP
jgi:hypothetical protein